MTRLEHLLTIVMEECAELSQRVSKAKRFGLRQIQEAADDKPEQNPDRLDNKTRIDLEFHDLLATMEMAGLIRIERPQSVDDNPGMPCVLVSLPLIDAKQAKVERYLARSLSCGTLDATILEAASRMATPLEADIGYTACWKTVDGKSGNCRMPEGHGGACSPF